TRRLAGAAIDHEVVGALGHLGVEVVQEHAQRCFLLPALATDLNATWRAHRTRTARGPRCTGSLVCGHGRLSFERGMDCDESSRTIACARSQGQASLLAGSAV